MNSGGFEPQPPVAPATTVQTDTQLFTVTQTDTTNTPPKWNVGDLVERVVVFDTSTGTVSSETWNNKTTGELNIGTVPGTDIAQVSTSGLTDAELRAQPVEVTVTNPVDQVGVEPGADTTTYKETYEATSDDVTNSPAEWSEGDVITREAVVDNTAVPPTVTYNYYNETTGLPIEAPSTPPATDELTKVEQAGLTDAELRATPVNVFVTNPTSPGPAPTEQKTTVQQYEATADDTNNTPAQWSEGDIITYETIYDYSQEPPVLIKEEWFNQTTGLPIDTTAPNIAPPADEISELPGTVTPPSVSRGITIDRITGASETIAAGTTAIDVYVESGFAIIAGQTFTTGYSFSWAIDNPGETLGDLVVDATNGVALVSYVR